MPSSVCKTRTAAAATATAAAAIASDPNTGESTLNYVISAVLKQPIDGNLAQALNRGGISEIFDLLLLSQADCDSLTFLDTDGLVTPPLYWPLKYAQGDQDLWLLLHGPGKTHHQSDRGYQDQV